MGERKVLNKYFPPDFDPKKVPRMKRDLEKQIGVRMMIPFSLQCNTCGEFMYRGKKFNSLKEDCIGEDYLGIRRFRFYIKCVICSQEITFKTDPEKGDYELETGASRNFESWTDKQATEDEHKKAREEEEKSDNMKQLENRTLDSKIELEIMDALDEIKAVNRRHETVDTANVLKASAARREKGAAGLAVAGGTAELDEDDALIANIRFGGSKVRRLAGSGSDDSDGADSADRDEEFNTADASKQGKGGKWATGMGEGGGEGAAKGKGKMRAAGASSQGVPQFRSARKPGAGPSELSGAEGALGEKGGGGGEGGDRAEGTGDGADSAAASGSMLLSAIEAQARREAEKAKLAAGATAVVVVKRKKKKSSSSSSSKGKGKDKDKDKGNKDSAGAEGGGGRKDTEEPSTKKRKKHKQERQQEHEENGGGDGGVDRKKGGSGGGAGGKGGVGVPAKKTEHGGDGVPTAAGEASRAAKMAGVSSATGAGAPTLGGLNLLGSYDSSSCSDDASR